MKQVLGQVSGVYLTLGTQFQKWLYTVYDFYSKFNALHTHV